VVIFGYGQNANFIDIGANCGLVSLILAKQNPKSKK
jgi:tRNA1(Val) A37 N6-methylase TrmN6